MAHEVSDDERDGKKELDFENGRPVERKDANDEDEDDA